LNDAAYFIVVPSKEKFQGSRIVPEQQAHLQPGATTQAIFDQGTEVGELARKLFPGGMVVAPGIINPDDVIAQTEKPCCPP
jgi:2-keto-3-deoxy-6-phosphogluconate aldolase